MMEGLVHVQKSNLEALRDVRDAMADQQKAAETRHTAMKGLLSGQREAVLHNGLQLEKIPGKFDELGDNLSHQTRAQGEIKGSVEAVGKSVRSLADGAQRAQNTLLAEFRRAQDEHGRRLEDLVERERKMSLIVGGLGFLVVVCLVFILVKTTA
jgi:methyl-accepting chemotaxis protein